MSTTCRRCAWLAALLAVAAVALAACGAPAPPPRAPGALGLVLGVRSNMPAPTLPPDFRDTLVEAIRSGDTLTLVGVSGEPRPSVQARLRTDCDVQEQCEEQERRTLAQVDQRIRTIRATAPEADTLGAIAVAARGMAGAAQDSTKRIVVVDNGLQTAGELHLQNRRAVFSDPAALAERLRADGRLPDLAGISITWVGLGSWSAPQGVPAQRARNNLEAIWSQVLRAAGAQDVRFTDPLPDGAPSAPGEPAVTPVDVSDVAPTPPDPCPTVFDDQFGGFRPNEATFVDPGRAREVLVPIAQGLVDRRQQVRLVGYVALPDPAGPGSLSERRAVAVRDVLVNDLGVPPTLLAVDGAGIAPGAAGAPEEALAQFRKVQVVAGNCGGTS